MIRRSDDGKLRILSLSYGKDSLACLGAIEELGLPLDGIVHAEVWATDDIPADLPPMVEFKAKADKIIKERWGFDVEHICAMTTPDKKYGVFKRPCEGGRNSLLNLSSTTDTEQSQNIADTSKDSHLPLVDGADISNCKVKLTYQDIFYRPMHKKDEKGGAVSSRTDRVCKQVGTLLQFRTQEASDPPISTDFLTPGGVVSQVQTAVPIGGWPRRGCQWCTGELKKDTTRRFSKKPHARGAETNIVQYLGIAADEPERIERHSKKKGIELPLVMIGWDEATARKWCEERDLLSPIYTSTARGGCWFCHYQSLGQLRLLRKNYPDLWALLLKWDDDSPSTFHADGHTVHDMDMRFYMEENGLLPKGKFRWAWVTDGIKPEPEQMSIDDYLR